MENDDYTEDDLQFLVCGAGKNMDGLQKTAI